MNFVAHSVSVAAALFVSSAKNIQAQTALLMSNKSYQLIFVLVHNVFIRAFEL